MSTSTEKPVAEILPEARREQLAADQNALTSADLTPDLKRRLDLESAPAWIPKNIGDVMVGKVAAVLRSEITNQYGHQIYPRIIIECSTGLFAIHVLGTVLEGWARLTRPVVGHTLALRFNGVRESSSGQKYADVTAVNADVASKEFDYDKDYAVPRTRQGVPITRDSLVRDGEPGF